MTTATKRNSTGIVLDAARDLHALEQLVTREALAEATGLKMTVIDDRTRALVDDGQLHRSQRGVFVPAVSHPPTRPMSKTVLSDGTVKIEIADQVLTLTPREDRVLAMLQAGAAAQLAAIEASRVAAEGYASLARRVLCLERENRALRGQAVDPAQLQLLGVDTNPL